MMRSLWTAATGMTAQALNVDVISNNLANVNTAGFKRGRANFQDLMYQQVSAAGSQNSAGNEVPSGVQVGLGVRTAGVSRIFSEGSFQQTGNPLDMAIEGRGFFEVQLPNGDPGYTRAGSFSVDSQGQLVTQDGYIVQPAMTIPNDALSIGISSDGTVSVVQPGNVQTTVGQIQLSDFSNPGGLTAIGHSIFKESQASGTPTTGSPGSNGIGSIAQSTLEMANGIKR
ncbi:MAG: flagellar basal-body rod protein FlgG [Mariprofundaceae bacterium]|nr:flagellar basal-body rod protein FlgG [Mariprofundaceae bacterium]